MKFYLKDNFELYLENEQYEEKVWLKQCFPKTMPMSYLSVLNQDDKEVLLINKLTDINIDSQNVISKYLKFKNYKIEIIDIMKISEEYGVRQWEVLSSKGNRVFQTAIQDWPKVNGSLVTIEDINNDVYFIDQSKINPESLLKLKIYID